MKDKLHVVALVLFLLAFFYDLVVWGGVGRLPDVGTGIADSARREAPLAASYITLGTMLDNAIPSLGDFGAARLTAAFGEGFERIRNDPTVAIDLIFGSSWNAAQSWLKFVYWAAPLLLVVTIILWVRKPKPIRTIRR